MSGTSVFSAYPAIPTTVLGRLAPASVGTSTQSSELLTGEWMRRFRRNQATKASGGMRAPVAPFIYPMLDPVNLSKPWKWHLRDRAAFVITTDNAGTAPLAAWGYWQMLSDVDPPKWVGIGFYARRDNQWYAFIRDSSDDSTERVVLDQASGLSASVLRSLHIEIDANAKIATFRIDGTVVATYNFKTTGTVLDKMGTIPPPVSWVVWSDGVTAPAQDVSLYAAMSGSVEGLVLELPDALAGGGPDKPTISVGATAPQHVDLVGSAYSHPGGLAHRLSVWQIDELGGDFSTPFKELVDGPPSSLVGARIDGLALQTTYFARVLYIDANWGVSPWSDAVAFSTGASNFVCIDGPSTSYACADS